MSYQSRRKQLLAGAYMAGPLVMLASVGAFLFGGGCRSQRTTAAGSRA